MASISAAPGLDAALVPTSTPHLPRNSAALMGGLLGPGPPHCTSPLVWFMLRTVFECTLARDEGPPVAAVPRVPQRGGCCCFTSQAHMLTHGWSDG